VRVSVCRVVLCPPMSALTSGKPTYARTLALLMVPPVRVPRWQRFTPRAAICWCRSLRPAGSARARRSRQRPPAKNASAGRGGGESPNRGRKCAAAPREKEIETLEVRDRAAHQERGQQKEAETG